MSTYSTNLKIELMQTGQNTGTWGNVTNTNLGTALEEAIVGNATITFNSADVNLNNSQYWDDLNSSLPARNVRLVLSGTSGGARQLIVPDGIEKTYIIKNNLADTVTVRTSAGAGVAVPTTKTMWVYSDSLNVVDVTTYLSSLALGTPLPVASGGTGSNTGVNVQTSISGVLPVANGGTGSATAAFNGSLITNLNATAITSGTLDNARTSANTANQSDAIVVRDTGGNFAANTITASLNGTASGNPTSIVAGTGLSGGGSSGAVTLSVQTTYQALGTYILAGPVNGTSTGTPAGGTASGGDLYPASFAGYATTRFGGSNDNTYYFAGNSSVVQQKLNSFSGTWQSMGASANATTNLYYPCTLYVRIA